MRITWLFATAAVLLIGFGLGLFIAPTAILGLYGLSVNSDGELVARILGGQLLGFVLLEVFALRGGRELRVATTRSVFVAEVTGFLVTAAAALQGRGNGLFLGIVAIFLVFTIWRGYYVVTYRSGATTGLDAKTGQT